jgi:hypothetical protein
VSIIATAIGTKVAVAALALAALGGGTAAAAAAGLLPTPAQEFAHQTVGAPSPSASETDAPEDPQPSTSASPVGPDATGPAAFGLCTAFTAGGLSTHSIAYGALLAASPSGDIAGYCGTVLSTVPGHSSTGHHTPNPHSTEGSDQTEGGSSHDAAGTHGH